LAQLPRAAPGAARSRAIQAPIETLSLDDLLTQEISQWVAHGGGKQSVIIECLEHPAGALEIVRDHLQPQAQQVDW